MVEVGLHELIRPGMIKAGMFLWLIFGGIKLDSFTWLMPDVFRMGDGNPVRGMLCGDPSAFRSH